MAHMRRMAMHGPGGFIDTVQRAGREYDAEQAAKQAEREAAEQADRPAEDEEGEPCS